MKAALPLLPGAERTVGARRGTGATRTASATTGTCSTGSRLESFGCLVENLFFVGAQPISDFRLLVEYLFFFVGAQPISDFRLLVVNRRLDRRQTGWMHPRMFTDVLTEGVMIHVASDDRRFRRFKPHVVPAEIFQGLANLPEPLRAHGGPGSALAGKETG